MTIDVVKTVQSTLASFPEWKPFGWKRNKKGQFETYFTKNIKQIIHYNYQAVEFTGKDFVVTVSQGFSSDDKKEEKYCQLEVSDLERTKSLYLKRIQDNNAVEQGNEEEILPKLLQLSSPNFNLVQEPDRAKRFGTMILTKRANTK